MKRRKSFHLRIGPDSRFLTVAAELPSDQIVGLQRSNRLQHLHLLVTNVLAIRAHRGLHRKIAKDLEEMVLNDVSNGAGLVVKSTAPLHPEFLCHGDLHALDVVSIPERLHERVGEPESHDVVHRPLGEIVVDSKDRGLGESRVQNAIELYRRGEIIAERLLDDDAGTLRGA